jgi:hypothetical protein
MALLNIDYRKGDARQKQSISNILEEGGYVGTILKIRVLSIIPAEMHQCGKKGHRWVPK